MEQRYTVVLKTYERRNKALAKAVKTPGKADDRRADRIVPAAATWSKLDRQFDDAGVTDCAENRRS